MIRIRSPTTATLILLVLCFLLFPASVVVFVQSFSTTTTTTARSITTTSSTTHVRASKSLLTYRYRILPPPLAFSLSSCESSCSALFQVATLVESTVDTTTSTSTTMSKTNSNSNAARKFSKSTAAATTTTTTQQSPHVLFLLDAKMYLQSLMTTVLNLKQKIMSENGVATALTYSFIGNIFTSIAVGVAWYGFSLQTGASPLVQGQWKAFLGWYARFYAIISLLKPVRLVLALGLTCHSARLLQYLETIMDSRRKAVVTAFGLLITCSSVMMATSIGLASMVCGVPIR